MAHRRGTVLYDADCGLCQWSSDTGERLDIRHRLSFVALQAVDLDALSPGLTLDQAREELFFVREDGRRFAGVDAVAWTLRCLPSPFLWLGMLLSIRPLAWLVAPIYRLVARNRAAISGWLGLTVCRIDRQRPSGASHDPSQGEGPARMSSIAYTFMTSSSTIGATAK